jgi:hypothetical protein
MAFGWVPCGRAPWHPLEAESALLLSEVSRHGRRLVGGELAPEKDDPVVAEAALAVRISAWCVTRLLDGHMVSHASHALYVAGEFGGQFPFGRVCGLSK